MEIIDGKETLFVPYSLPRIGDDAPAFAAQTTQGP
jgi:hypothetical protein